MAVQGGWQADRDACSNGHTYQEGSYRRDRHGHRVCLVCKRLRNAGRQRTAAERERNARERRESYHRLSDEQKKELSRKNWRQKSDEQRRKHRDRAREYYQANKDRQARLRRELRAAAKLGIPVEEYRKSINTFEDMAHKDQFESFNYTPQKGSLRDQLDIALDNARHNGEAIPCEADPDAYFDVTVSKSQAEALCSDCPMAVYAACYAFGATERQDDPETQQIIYGGKRFLHGVEVK